jgi:hypothetical protein
MTKEIGCEGVEWIHLAQDMNYYRDVVNAVINLRATGSIANIFSSSVSRLLGRAIAQAVSGWLLTAAARVRSRVWSSGICGEQCGAGVGFLRVYPANLHSTKFSIIIITRGRLQ